MAQNDYHVIVYRILAYLYAQLKEGKAVDAEYNRIVEKFLIKQRKNGVFEWLN